MGVRVPPDGLRAFGHKLFTFTLPIQIPMRLYCFSLTQLKQLHQGVQNVHSAVDLFVKYMRPEEDVQKYDMLVAWATSHKTVIFKDGKFAADLLELHDALQNSPYPWTIFSEDEGTLFSIPTSISIVLPAKVYEAADHVRNGGIFTPSATGKVFFNNHVLTPWDMQFLPVLNQYPLAH